MSSPTATFASLASWSSRASSALVAVLVLLGLGACTRSGTVPLASAAWSRPTAPLAEVGQARDDTVPGVAYLIISNPGPAEVLLGGASSEICDRVELHRSAMKDGVMHMEPVTGPVAVPPGGWLELAPGGLHAMLLGLHRPLRPGDHYRLLLEFVDVGVVGVDVEVRSP